MNIKYTYIIYTRCFDYFAYCGNETGFSKPLVSYVATHTSFIYSYIFSFITSLNNFEHVYYTLSYIFEHYTHKNTRIHF